jgi:hypothetical protein
MRIREPQLIMGALGLAVLAVSVVAVQASIAHANAIRAMSLTATIVIDRSIHETFAPPPSSAAPAMTPLQAFSQWEQQVGGRKVTAIPASVTVQLGLLTFPVGPDCGAECHHGNIIRDGMAYHALNELAYGYSTSNCKPGSTRPASRCLNWTFLDAATGQPIDKTLNRAGPSRRPPDVLQTAPAG